MDQHFVFPRPKAPIPRPLPEFSPTAMSTSPSTAAPTSAGIRESNALRASVLDAALQLGIGSNNTVANWMFNNPLEEEDEDETSPGLTSGSTATSEESSSANTPSSSHAYSAGAFNYNNTNNKFSYPQGPNTFDPVGSTQSDPTSYVLNAGPRNYIFDSPTHDTTGFSIPAVPVPVPSRPVTPNKLRKRRGDGYESDGGYVSEGGRKKRKEKDKERERDKVKEKPEEVEPDASKADTSKADKKEKAKEEKEAKARAKEEKKAREKELKALKKSSSKGKDKDGDNDAGYATGYETDAPTPSKKTKTKTKLKPTGADAGYETDDGYLSSTPASKKKKSRFFGLGIGRNKGDSRESAKDEEKEKEEEEVPEVPMMPLPIAERFATTLAGSRAGTPLPSAATGTGTSMSSIFTSSTTSTSTAPSLSSFASPSTATTAPTSAYPSASSSSSPYPALPGSTSSQGHEHDRDSLGSQESFNSADSVSSRKRARRGVHVRGGSLTGSIASIELGVGGGAVVGVSGDAPVVSVKEKEKDKGKGKEKEKGTSKFPAISYPITRSPSPAPPAPVSILNTNTNGNGNGKDRISRLKHIPNPLSFSPQPQSPPQSQAQNSTTHTVRFAPQSFSPESPYVLVTPVSASSPGASLPPSPRPGFRQPHGYTSANPNLNPTGAANAKGGLMPTAATGASQNRASQMSIVASSEYIVPSPLPSPSVLAYYDLPPPSPPPSGPLPLPPVRASGLQSRSRSPSVPPSIQARPKLHPLWTSIPPEARSASPSAPSSHSQLHSRSQSPGGLFSQPIPTIQRGRESPFPAQPILPGYAGGIGVGGGLEARVRVRRYRDLYAIASPAGGWDKGKGRESTGTGMPGIRIEEPSDEEDGGRYEDGAYGYEEGEEDEEEMRDVLERFSGVDFEDGGVEIGRALERSRSYEARSEYTAGEDIDDDDRSRYPDEDKTAGRSTMFLFEGSVAGGSTERNSRWSGSIYSRASFLDGEKSGEARERFVKRVEAMYDPNGREVGAGSGGMSMGSGIGWRDVIPPVPKLPEGLIGGKARVVGRF